MSRPEIGQPASVRGGSPDLPRTSVWAIPGMIALGMVAVTGFSGYAALLPAAPLYVVREGSADSAGAGAVNFVLLSATVATQFAVPGLIRRFGWGPVLAAGLVLMGVPSLLHGLTSELAPTLALSAVRGVGFGILTVAGSAAAVLLVQPGRRGAAVGAYSLALSVPNILLMPSGGWIGDTWGFWPVFVLGAVPLLGIPACFALARRLPERSTHAPDHPQSPSLPVGRSTYLRLVAPSLILLTVTLAGGALITFAPQLVAVPWLAAAGLLAFGLTSTITRWRIGAFSDRVGVDRLLWPFVVLIVLGLAALAWVVRTPVGTGQAGAWLVACAVVGISYGALQNLTMLQAFAAAGPRGVGTASAVWNAGFDTGTGSGALVVGAVALTAGFGPAVALTAVLCLLTLPSAVRAALRSR